jgi:hypothetical protein
VRAIPASKNIGVLKDDGSLQEGRRNGVGELNDAVVVDGKLKAPSGSAIGQVGELPCG